MSKLTAVSLFAGVGGFDLAMERQGINVVAIFKADGFSPWYSDGKCRN